MKIIWQLFKTFFIIGGFTFGGGYAMLQLIRDEIVERKKWMTDEEFLDLFAVAQSLPGVFAVNMAIFIGYKIKKVPGAIACAIGATLPSFVIMLVIALFFTRIQDNPDVQRVFKGLRPAVVALIAAPVITTWQAMKLGWKMIWIPTLCAIAIWLFGISPVTVIIISGLLGWMYTMFIKKKLPTHQDHSDS